MFNLLKCGPTQLDHPGGKFPYPPSLLTVAPEGMESLGKSVTRPQSALIWSAAAAMPSCAVVSSFWKSADIYSEDPVTRWINR